MGAAAARVAAESHLGRAFALRLGAADDPTVVVDYVAALVEDLVVRHDQLAFLVDAIIHFNRLRPRLQILVHNFFIHESCVS